MTDVYQWRRVAHIPFLIILQIIFIILFGLFVVYDPEITLGPPDPTTPKPHAIPTPDQLTPQPPDKTNVDNNSDKLPITVINPEALIELDSNQEHGSHLAASKMISNIYPCT